ncbi:MAG TPA: MauE/DoxX family redox-associated membrane protein [Burkholderiaceae bacterium]|nr:MauE/DoxX family redox-associated membrane protein [Burkholderiaceae bacterium]
MLPAIDPVFAHSAAAVVGAVLLIGAVEKLREPESWRDALENYKLLPSAAVPAFARTLPLLEILAGVLLLPLATRQLGALVALALLAMFTAAIAINLLRGRDRIDCGCGGNAHTPLSTAVVLRTVVLMLLAVAAAAPLLGRATVWLDFVAAGLATLFLLGLYFLANSMLGRQAQLLDLRNSP